MKRQHDYQIGQWVRVLRRLRRECNQLQGKPGAEVVWLRDYVHRTERAVGQVIGVTRRYAGMIDPGYSRRDYFGEDDYEPPHFVRSGSFVVVQVRLGLANVPLEALPCDLESCAPLPDGLPRLYNRPRLAVERASQAMKLRSQRSRDRARAGAVQAVLLTVRDEDE